LSLIRLCTVIIEILLDSRIAMFCIEYPLLKPWPEYRDYNMVENIDSSFLV